MVDSVSRNYNKIIFKLTDDRTEGSTPRGSMSGSFRAANSQEYVSSYGDGVKFNHESVVKENVHEWWPLNKMSSSYDAEFLHYSGLIVRDGGKENRITY